MKLLTLNTHSLQEEAATEKLRLFADFVAAQEPDVIALQEVSQTTPQKAELAPEYEGILAHDPGRPLTPDNYLIALIRELESRKKSYYGAWQPIKLGYEIYEEGVALLSRTPIRDTDNVLLSSIDDFSNWKTRRALGIKTDSGWFYSTHMGWWNDDEEPFARQWHTLNARMSERGFVALMGDFNAQANVLGEGYDLVRASGWHDTYKLAHTKDDGITVSKTIDGWKKDEQGSKASQGTAQQRMRIDYIFINEPVDVVSSEVVCNGVNGPQVSDHAGILVDLAPPKDSAQ